MATKASIFLNTTRITTKMMYKTYIKKNPQSTIALTKNYSLFKTIVEDCHKEVINECLKGGVYSFGSNLGIFAVTKHERRIYIDKNGNARGMSVDFGATRKNKASGGNEVIYNTNSIICHWEWLKAGSHLTNKTGWQLAVTDGPRGIARKLHNYIESNERATLNYMSNEFKFKENINNE